MTGVATAAEFRRDVNAGNSADRSCESRGGHPWRMMAGGMGGWDHIPGDVRADGFGIPLLERSHPD
jgi:hypothetical protein